jgi:hypothetical protein
MRSFSFLNTRLKLPGACWVFPSAVTLVKTVEESERAKNQNDIAGAPSAKNE